VKFTRWIWVAIPVIGVFEVAAHAYFAARPPKTKDWDAVAKKVNDLVTPGMLVIVAPHWAEPEARRVLGDSVLTLEDVARPDETGYAKALEISILGQDSGVSGWHRLSETQSGKFRLRVFENPKPAPVLVDLVELVQKGQARASSVRGKDAVDCRWSVNARVENGALSGHPTFPKTRFECEGEAWHMVGATVIEDEHYLPRRCIWAQPAEGEKTIVHFEHVTLGERITGYGALPFFLEREAHGTPVDLEVLVDDDSLGRFRHSDGEGWKGFEFSTEKYRGQTHELEFRVSSKRSRQREFCFQAAVR
jgi:hypothetical protein